MGPISSKIIIQNKKPLKLNYAYHINTPIKGILLKSMHILKILDKLYPTPALAGSPVTDSIKIIQKVERFDRGWYGGSIGIFTTGGNGKFYVPIRSCLIKKNEIFFYSGGGIMKKSQPLCEWEETETKLEHLKSIFNELIQNNID